MKLFSKRTSITVSPTSGDRGRKYGPLVTLAFACIAGLFCFLTYRFDDTSTSIAFLYFTSVFFTLHALCLSHEGIHEKGAHVLEFPRTPSSYALPYIVGSLRDQFLTLDLPHRTVSGIHLVNSHSRRLDRPRRTIHPRIQVSTSPKEVTPPQPLFEPNHYRQEWHPVHSI